MNGIGFSAAGFFQRSHSSNNLNFGLFLAPKNGVDDQCHKEKQQQPQNEFLFCKKMKIIQISKVLFFFYFFNNNSRFISKEVNNNKKTFLFILSIKFF